MVFTSATGTQPVPAVPKAEASLAQGMALAPWHPLHKEHSSAWELPVLLDSPDLLCPASPSGGSVSQLWREEGPSGTSWDTRGWSWAAQEEQDLSSQAQNPLCPTSGAQGSPRCPGWDGHPWVLPWAPAPSRSEESPTSNACYSGDTPSQCGDRQ